MIVAIRIDPSRRVMPRRILPCHYRDSSGRANAHGIKIIETNSASRQSFHVRSAIVIVERISLRLSLFVGKKRDRSIHHPHVVDEENDDIRFLRCDDPLRKEPYENG